MRATTDSLVLRALTREQFDDISALRKRRERRSASATLLEGERLVEDALRNGAALRMLIVRDDEIETHTALLHRAARLHVPLFVTSAKKFARLADTEHPQGIAAVADIPRMDAEAALMAVPEHIPVVALHEVSDPGNLGTIIRSMDWFGAPLLLLSRGSVDAWNAKVVRASMGSIFRVNIAIYEQTEQLQRLAADTGRMLTVTVPEGGTTDVASLLRAPLLLLFGSEAHGLPPALIDAAGHRVSIPRRGGAESLNLAMAHAILMYALDTAAHSLNPDMKT